MFDLNRHYNQPIVPSIPVYHTNGRFIKNKIGMVMHRLVGMGPKALSV